MKGQARPVHPRRIRSGTEADASNLALAVVR
jgi:hypothetical protein